MNLRAVGVRNGGPALLSYREESGLYRNRNDSLSLTHAQLLAEAQAGTTTVTLTAALRSDYGSPLYPEPLLSTATVGVGATGDPPLPNITSGGANPPAFSVRGLDVRSDSIVLVDGVRVTATVACTAGTSGDFCVAPGGFAGAGGSVSIDLAARPAPDGLHLLQVRAGAAFERAADLRRRRIGLPVAGQSFATAARRGALCALLAALVSAPGHAGEPGAAGLLVVVCDAHHHVLRHWLEASAEGLLPESGVSVVHFDAHPDLGPPPRPIERSWRTRPGALVAAVDIESFQLAAVWVGLVESIVWLRPSWAFQLPDGVRRFRVGLGVEGRLQVDEPADYYVLDGHYAPTHALRDAVELELKVISLSAALPGVPLQEGPVVLDIDLDGFATRSPAADRLRDAGYTDAELGRIRSAFAREHLALPEDPAARVVALQDLVAALAQLSEGDLAAQLSGAAQLWWLGVPAADLWFLYGLVADEARGLPLNVLLEEGRSLVGLPERSANAAEIEETATRLAGLVGSGAVRPALVTIARSVNDGFTPAAAWPGIEERLLDALRAVRPGLEVRYDRGLRPAPRP